MPRIIHSPIPTELEVFLRSPMSELEAILEQSHPYFNRRFIENIHRIMQSKRARVKFAATVRKIQQEINHI